MKLKSITRTAAASAAFSLAMLAPATAVYAHPSNPHANNNYHKNKKVFVCKYVGKPHVNERLQTGQNPISVSTHAIQHNGWNGQIPGWFSDAQGRSYVIAYDYGQPEPSAKDCPVPDCPKPVTPPVTPPVKPPVTPPVTPTTPSTPGQGGGGHVLGSSTTASVAPTAQLVNTGGNAWVNAIVGAVLIGLTLAIALMPKKQQVNL